MKRLIVLLGVAGVSLSALLVRWSTAPSLILALYRMAFAAALMTPAALGRESWSGLRRRELLLSVLSGAFLGLHFVCYFEALNRTSIASAVVLVDTEVLFVALASALILRKRLRPRARLAVLTAFGGGALVALADRSGGTGALTGDLIALAGAVCVSAYTMLGAVCRARLTTAVYTTLVYLAASGTLLGIALASGTPLLGYGPVNLLTGLGMAVFCTLLGHSVFSWGLKYLPPAFISTVKLLEPVFSALYGLVLFGERPGGTVILGGALILAGIGLYSREEA